MTNTAYKSNLITLDEFIIEAQRKFPQATGDLSQLLRDITLACRIIADEANYNVQREMRSRHSGQKFDRLEYLRKFAVEQFRFALDRSGMVSRVITAFSTEPLNMSSSTGKYMVALHPIEGIPNMAYNTSAATVFGIYKTNPEEPADEQNFLQPGKNLIASGYVLYGSSTMLVFTTAGLGVNFFTLDHEVGDFFLSRRNIKIPDDAPMYSCNTGWEYLMDQPDQSVLEYFRANSFKGDPYRFRYIGSLSADMHRILLEGGIFLYPKNKNSPEGRLNLIYECAPVAFVIEQAGGIATDGKQRILDKIPEKIEAKSPFYAGSPALMKRVGQVRNGKEPA